MSSIVIELIYIVVEVETFDHDPFLGLAHTTPEILKDIKSNQLEFAVNLTDISLTTLMEWGHGTPGLKKVIGIATLNALSQHVLEIKNPHEFL